VAVLVVLYSINVFLTFSLSKLGLCIYWWRQRGAARNWLRRLALSALGLAITASILVVTLAVKFAEGGWLTVLVTGSVVGLCLLTKHHYVEIRRELARTDALYADEPDSHDAATVPKLDAAQPVAVLLVGKHRGASMHALLWVQRLFPDHFKNFVFLAVGEVDAQSYAGPEKMQKLRETIEKSLRYYTGFCHRHGLAAEYRMAFGTDPLEEFTELTRQALDQYPNSVCFASKLIFTRNNFLTAWLHNKTPLAMQARLHREGKQMIVLPMNMT
jgi:K+ transporter